MKTALATHLCIFLYTLPSSVQAVTTVDFTKDIQPILATHCYSCHGEDKGLGRLRLHTTEAISESIEAHNDLLMAGKPEESELYARLVLPADDKKRMPKGAEPLSEEQSALVKQWIAEGAVFTSATAPTGEQASEDRKPLERPEVEPADPKTIADVEATGALVIPLYAGSHALRVSFPSTRSEVTDETVAALVPLAPQLVDLDLSGTQISDTSAESLRQLQNLVVLHLEKTPVTDQAVQAVSGMKYLRYLNLHSTKVTDKALEPLKGLPSLQKLYVWQTEVSFDAAKQLEKTLPGLDVNLGWDHPGVVRERLNAELARVKEQQAEATKAIEQAKQELETAQSQGKAADERAAELTKQLEALDQPAEQPAAPVESQSEPAEKA